MPRQLLHNEVASWPASNPVVLVLDNVRDSKNVGALFRLADAMGLRGLCLCGETPKPPSAAIDKASRSASNWVPFWVFPHTEQALQQLASEGYRLLGLELSTHSVPLHQLHWPAGQATALVLGSEKNGIGAEALNLLSDTTHIPMHGRNSSMNVAMAAAIAVYELARGNSLGVLL